MRSNGLSDVSITQKQPHSRQSTVEPIKNDIPLVKTWSIQINTRINLESLQQFGERHESGIFAHALKETDWQKSGCVTFDAATEPTAFAATFVDGSLPPTVRSSAFLFHGRCK